MGLENVSQSMNRLLRSFIGTVCVSDSTSVVERLLRVSTLTLRRLRSYIYIYIYGAPILDVSRSHTTTQHNR